MAALRAEGIPCSAGLGTLGPTGTPMHREGVIEDALCSRSYQKIYSQKRLEEYRVRNICPESDRLSQEVVGFSQRMLLGDRNDIQDIARALWKVHENSDKLSRTGS
jgi:hypothetical protein